jgi:hypothetical protein
MRARPIAAAKWLSAAGRAEQQQIGALAQPAVTGGERSHLRLGDHRHGLEVEAVEGFSSGQTRLNEMALDAAAAAFGDLVLGDGGEGGPPANLPCRTAQQIAATAP